MEILFDGIVISLNPQPANAQLPTSVIVAGSVTFLRFLQPQKASSSIFVTPLLRTSVVIFVLFLNALYGISVTVPGIVTEVKVLGQQMTFVLALSNRIPFSTQKAVFEESTFISASDVQPSKTDEPIVLTLAGIVTLVRAEQLLKVLLLIAVKPFGRTTLFRLLQLVNAPMPIDVTLPLNVIDSRALQYIKALLPIVFTLEGITIDFSADIYKNALSGKLVTVSGMVSLVVFLFGCNLAKLTLTTVFPSSWEGISTSAGGLALTLSEKPVIDAVPLRLSTHLKSSGVNALAVIDVSLKT